MIGTKNKHLFECFAQMSVVRSKMYLNSKQIEGMFGTEVLDSDLQPHKLRIRLSRPSAGYENP